MIFWTPRGNNKRATIDVYRCYLAGRRHAGAVAIRQLLSAADHGHHFAAEHTDPWLEPARARRVPGLRVHHFVDSAVPVHQHGRAQVQARLSPVPSPSHVTPSAPSQDRLSTWRHPLRNVTGRVLSGAVFAPQNVRRSFSVGCVRHRCPTILAGQDTSIGHGSLDDLRAIKDVCGVTWVESSFGANKQMEGRSDRRRIYIIISPSPSHVTTWRLYIIIFYKYDFL